MKTLLATLACLLVLLSLAACGDDDDTATPTTSATATTSATTPAATTATATTPAVTATPQDVCLANPDPATPDMNNVTAPVAFAQVTSPVQITGQISVFEAQFNITIYDAQGNVIADEPAMSDEGQTLAPFSVSVPFTATVDTPACIWVYDISNEDGVAKQDVVQIPVLLQP
jgi:hypothetical protein